MLAEGRYPAQAKRGEIGLTETGKEQVGVEFEIADGAYKGERIPWFGFFTDLTRERTIEALRYAGWVGDNIEDLSSLERPDTPIVELVIEHESYKDKVHAKVRWVNRPGGVAMKNAIPDQQRRAFAAQVRLWAQGTDAVMKMNGGAGMPPPPKSPPSGAQGDIPF